MNIKRPTVDDFISHASHRNRKSYGIKTMLLIITINYKFNTETDIKHAQCTPNINKYINKICWMASAAQY